MIKCISCKFVKEDKAALEGQWKAYECSNPKSEYHKALLNVTPDGGMLTKVSWAGCPHGERKVILKCQESQSTHAGIQDAQN